MTMSKLLSRKLAVTLGSIVTIVMGIDDHWKAAIVGFVAAAYVIAQALVDKEAEKVTNAIVEGIELGKKEASKPDAGKVQARLVPPGTLPPGSAAMIALFVLCLALLVACSGSQPFAEQAKPLIREATKGYTVVQKVCVFAQVLDGRMLELDAAELCSKQEFARPWMRKLEEAAAIVEAQRAGKPDVDPPLPAPCAPVAPRDPPAPAPTSSFNPSPSATP
jgi:hypothetical protein